LFDLRVHDAFILIKENKLCFYYGLSKTMLDGGLKIFEESDTILTQETENICSLIRDINVELNFMEYIAEQKNSFSYTFIFILILRSRK
jgi:hypothetical protein